MKTTHLVLALISFLTVISKSTFAQKGNNQLSLIGEASFAEDNNMGFGGFLKGAYGVKNNAQVTLQIGVTKFKSSVSYFDSNGNELDKTTTRLIPVLVGYKRYLKQFYIEPQLGFGELGGREDIGGDWARPSVGAFFWAAGAGFQFNKMDLGLRYQNAHATGGKDAGTWGDKQFSFVGVHVGYAFNL